MHFQILQLILWPKNGEAPRPLQFHPGVVNVITGASKSGKSAVIPIIDYCLASRHCAIPVGVIRESCAWFGILVDTIEGQKLLARKEPGQQTETGEMFILEGEELAIPQAIAEGNTSAPAVRETLDRLAGLTQLDFEPGTESGFKARPSFRDLTAFMFQPQNIVANPNVLFYKADSNKHREKLKSVLPYVLNAIDAKTIALRHAAEQIERKLRKLESELLAHREISAKRVIEGRTWLTQARELGLSDTTGMLNDWTEILGELERVAVRAPSDSSVSSESIEGTLDALEKLRSQEQSLSAEASTHRSRLMEIKRAREGSYAYAGAMSVQRDRLSLSRWMREEIEKRRDEHVLFPSDTALALDKLDAALEEVESKLYAHPFATSALDAEYQRQRVQMEEVLAQINLVRHEIRVYEASSELVHAEVARAASAERFVGGLQQMLRQHEEANRAPEIESEIELLRARLDLLNVAIHESGIERRLNSALDAIERTTGAIVRDLPAEWKESPVRLAPSELTVQVHRRGRKDYLWEIGSGANWLAYHVAVTLALQLYFLKNSPSPVPGLLIYDQPSQVYFPTVKIDKESGEKDFTLDMQEDIQAVRQVFRAMARTVKTARGQLQIIVLDHADQAVWGELPNVELVEEWRGKKLVPLDW